MKRIASIVLGVVIAAGTASAQSGPEEYFEPFQQWMGAVLTGDAATLRSLYSTDPAAKVRVKGMTSDSGADTGFWLGLKPRTMTVDVVRNEPRHGHISFIFRSTVVSSQGQTLTLTDDQSWQLQGGKWRLIYVERTDDPALRQPADMKKNLYPADADAHAELKEAEEKAAKEHKRLLLVFGANWCFDCHVLDLAFQRPDLTPVLAANYHVVHVDIGPDGKKNEDIAKQFDVSLDKGVPVIAVADPDGKVVVSENNGEFEDARQLTPEFVAQFLNKWKPAKAN
jgi:thioredoxin 1